jgi:hypothetical protein
MLQKAKLALEQRVEILQAKSAGICCSLCGVEIMDPTRGTLKEQKVGTVYFWSLLTFFWEFADVLLAH